MKNISNEVLVGGIFRGTILSLGTMVTFNQSQGYRDQNVVIQAYDAQKVDLLPGAELILREGSDPDYAKTTMPILRNETASSTSADFKFLKLQPDIYSFYGNKAGYFEDSFSTVVIGKSSPSYTPNVYLLPKYDSDQGTVWF